MVIYVNLERKLESSFDNSPTSSGELELSYKSTSFGSWT